MAPISDLDALLRTMEPVLHPGTFAFVSVPEGRPLDPSVIVASILEPEGLSVIVDRATATIEGLTPACLCAWITLSVASDLHAVGLTAAFADALAKAGVSCNVVAGTHHDHIFVPVDQAEAAMGALRALQRAASA